jgi:Fanconi anemia group M protein
LSETQGSLPLKKYLYKLHDAGTTSAGSKADKRIAADPKFKSLYAVSSLWEEELHPKLTHLPTLILEELADNPDSKMIVFASYRDTVNMIVSALKENGISANRFVGQAGKATEKGLTQKKQTQVMDKFRNGDFKVLVSTSVGEEGLDIPSCNHIFFYEPVASEVRSIQRRGRTGRFETGRVSVLITKGTVDETYWNVSRRKEEKMRGQVVGTTL